MQTEPLITAAEAARLVGVSRQLINHWRHRGWLHRRESGIVGVYGYRPSEVLAVKERARPSGYPAGRPRKAGDETS